MKILKEKIMKKLLRNISISLLTLLAFITPSCEIGLGAGVDLIAPEITITTPERSSYITQTVTVVGVATDNLELTKISVKVEETNQAFEYEDSVWYSVSEGERTEYANAGATGDETSLNWYVTIPIVGAVSGNEYTIIAQAFDYYGNEGKTSIDERNVTIDTTDPVVSLIEPVVHSKFEEAKELNEQYELKNNSILLSLYNETITISGSQKEDAKLDRLNVYIDAQETVSIGSEVTDYFVKKEVTGANIRNWSTAVEKSELPEEYQTGKHLLRVITESYDVAGNVERKVQGWFTYWNEADIPWITADFGGDSLSERKDVYPGSTLQGQAYDDDGIKTISINYYQANGTKVDSKCQTINLENDGCPTYYAWSVDSSGATGVFYLIISCIDKNGVSSGDYTKYIQISDVNPPSITITSPVNNSKLPVSGNLDLNFTGTVSDDDSIASLKMVRLAEGNEGTAINYFSSSYDDWNKASESGYKVPSGETAGNTVYKFALTEAGYDHAKHNYSFNKTLNLVDAFGIDGSTQKLKTQSFIFMATDGSGSNTIEMISCTGDTQNPTVKITHISIDNGVNWKPIEEITGAFSGLTTNSPIKFKGTWSDNSSKVNGLVINWPGAKLNGSESITVQLTPPTTPDANGNYGGEWITGTITPPNSLSTVSVSAELKDWGGNSGKASIGFTVDNSDPMLVRITSETPDGSYTVGQEIVITMEFNKNIILTGTPKLKLNLSGDKYAVYDSGSGSTVLKFKYTVVAGDNISKLHVTSLDKDGCTFKDSSSDKKPELSSISKQLDENEATSLAGSRTICIDTTAPTLDTTTPFEVITPNGSYKAGKEIFIKANFSEDVDFSNASLLELSLNAKTSLTTTSCTKSGSRSVTFKYTVAEGENASPLKITGFSLNGCTITDAAGNTMVAPSATHTTAITIDTTKPDTPSISGITNNSMIYSNDGVSFTVSYAEDGGTKEYSIDGGNSWTTYPTTGGVSLTNNGTYNVTARQTDATGNVSLSPTAIKITVDKGQILTSLKAAVADGTYTTGNKIKIILRFRNTVKISGNERLVLNSSTTNYAILSSAARGKELQFEYTVREGDSCSTLVVNSIDATIEDDYGNIISDYVKLGGVTTGNRFQDNSSIEIVTDAPEVDSVKLNDAGNKLTISFNSVISKYSGIITIEQAADYIAPAVLDVTTFNNLKAKNKTSGGKNITDYYTSGTNGSDADGNSDLTEKYILDFNTATNNSTLLEILKASDADKVIVPINSSYVTTSGTDVIISLTDSYKLPVKGATYKVTFDSDLVKNLKGTSCTAYNNEEGSVTCSGVEAPVIRVEKKNETISGSGDSMTVTQPLKANVKIDCQTPDVTYTRSLKSQTNNMDAYEKGSSAIQKKNKNLTDTTALTSNTFEIGTDDKTQGNIYHISVTATKKGESATAHEYAYRSTYRVIEPPTSDVGGSYKQLYVRGGDWTSGGNSTPGFPVSWNTAEFDKVRAMTKDGDDNTWDYVTWQINTNAYLQPLRGDRPTDAATKGPSVWCWGMQGPIPSGLENYILYPGQAISIDGSINYVYGDMSFYYKHCEYRDGNSVIKKRKTN